MPSSPCNRPFHSVLQACWGWKAPFISRHWVAPRGRKLGSPNGDCTRRHFFPSASTIGSPGCTPESRGHECQQCLYYRLNVGQYCIKGGQELNMTVHIPLCKENIFSYKLQNTMGIVASAVLPTPRPKVFLSQSLRSSSKSNVTIHPFSPIGWWEWALPGGGGSCPCRCSGQQWRP
jgi:hypothetical protein